MANRRSIQQFESGLDELISYRGRSQPHRGPHGLDEAAKRKWANCELYSVWQLVAFHSGVDPDSRISRSIALNGIFVTPYERSERGS
jgi:hypothetical protein